MQNKYIHHRFKPHYYLQLCRCIFRLSFSTSSIWPLLCCFFFLWAAEAASVCTNTRINAHMNTKHPSPFSHTHTSIGELCERNNEALMTSDEEALPALTSSVTSTHSFIPFLLLKSAFLIGWTTQCPVMVVRCRKPVLIFISRETYSQIRLEVGCVCGGGANTYFWCMWDHSEEIWGSWWSLIKKKFKVLLLHGLKINCLVHWTMVETQIDSKKGLVKAENHTLYVLNLSFPLSSIWDVE